MKPPIPPHILELEPYRPGRPIEEVERELGIRAIKLASNENPLGPSPLALEAIRRALADVHRYPDGSGVVLRAALAERLGVESDRVLLGNGSNELIELVVRTFVGPGEQVVFSEGAFLIYDLVARTCRAEPVEVAAKGFSHDLEAIAAAVGERTRVVFLANPNNPTGTIFRRAEWHAFLDRIPAGVIVAVDQAYAEYACDPEYPDAICDLERHPGVLVLRTFSKIYGLAGLRIGYAAGSRELIDAMARVRAPFSVNSLAQAAALAALSDEDHVERSRRTAWQGLRMFAEAFSELGLEFVPSQANFVLVDVGDGARVATAMLQHGVIVRPMNAYRMPSMIRVTAGTEEENRRCIEVLRQVLSEENR
ncbi:MAG: histidinol-phosphate transaminase [Deltaproteobacteria bacterium]|nr:MAG: histidinol-phosphate transaminase [Deltaproteobacteria bacterium]